MYGLVSIGHTGIGSEVFSVPLLYPFIVLYSTLRVEADVTYELAFTCRAVHRLQRSGRDMPVS